MIPKGKFREAGKVKILAIETSCDETAIALLEASGSIKNPAAFELIAGGGWQGTREIEG
ncbi:hypothetical protein HYV91_02090 [Candidatus Wolfebacteria bacterium]|nr:hypothetical protein [Candidatus Wolfebacteria bacterium]